MKVLKWIGVVILVIAVLGFVVSLFLPSSFEAENEITINAPVENVFEEVNTIANWDNWEPWSLSDPTTKTTYEGPECGMGATRIWDGKKVKTGKIVIVESIENTSINTELYFRHDKPSYGFWKFEQSGEETKVTWGFKSDIGFNPIARIMMVMMSKKMDESQLKGLNKIKELAEAKPIAPKYEIAVEDFPATTYIGIRKYIATTELPEFCGMAYTKIPEFCAENNVQIAGMPVAFYHSFTEVMDSFDTEASFPVVFETEIELPEGFVLTKLDSGKVVTTIHKGPYDKVASAWEAVMAYVGNNGFTMSGASWEEYLNDPQTTSQEELLTKIYIPIQ